jgi:hypothetical protein
MKKLLYAIITVMALGFLASCEDQNEKMLESDNSNPKRPGVLIMIDYDAE